MEFSLNVAEVLIAALVAYGLLKLEFYLRVWYYARHQKPSPPKRASIKEISTITSAAATRECGKCHNPVRSYVEYEDGDAWCIVCDQIFEDDEQIN